MDRQLEDKDKKKFAMKVWNFVTSFFLNKRKLF